MNPVLPPKPALPMVPVMPLAIVSADDIPFARWKNGGGLTRELLAWPSPEAWRVRVSVADLLDDGPFSPHPGIDRWFGLLSGDGVELQWTKAVRRMDLGRRLLHFDGGLVPHARLMGGPASALNIMVRKGTARAKVEAAQAGKPAPTGFRFAALFARDPVALLGERRRLVPGNSLAWGPRSDDTVELPRGAHAWWVAFDSEGLG